MRVRRNIFFAVLCPALLLILSPPLIRAGNNPKAAIAVRTPVRPVIDGRLDEHAWALAMPETSFVQFVPLEGALPNERTEIRILYDDEAVYIGCRMYDADPKNIVARLARRDDQVEADYVSIRIDSYNDNQTDFEFTVNASGAKSDVLGFDDGARNDPSWDVVWDAATTIDEKGWVAEIEIPFRVLRFTPQTGYDWGLQILRHVSRTQEDLHWVLIRKSENGSTSRFGHLRGIRDIPTGSDVELLPYVLGSGKLVPVSPGYPDGRDLTSNAGFDLKYRPGVSLTVDATVNPDFGQVEADPAVLNLSTFPTFYPEKRPFFIEGTQIIHFSTFGDNAGPGLFYSRRIGRPISVTPPPGGYVERQPDFAAILLAAKVSGKTQGGLSIGALEAMTRQGRATLVDSSGIKTDPVVEPLSNFSLIRLKQDVFANSNVGMILTSVSRDGTLPATTGGIDWNLRFLQNEYRIDGFLAASHTTTADPIEQTSGGYLTGAAGRIGVNKEGGAHWRWALDYDFTGKQFNIDDMGYFRRPNDRGTVNTLQYRMDEPGETIRNWNVTGLYHYRTNFDGAWLFNTESLTGDLRLLNYWEFVLQLSLDQGRYDDRETRGNGLYRKPENRGYFVQVSSDPRLPLVGSLQVGGGADGRGSDNWYVTPQLEIRAASSVTLQFSLSHAHTDRFFAWVANRTSADDPSLPAGLTSSIFSERTVSQWDFTTRGSFVFSQNLTLQYYLQIFIAKQKFENTQRMIASDTFAPYVYNPPLSANPDDATDLSLNSNLVLRWEYLPGSTAYLVWSQSRAGSAGSYSSPFGETFNSVFGVPSTNVLLLKISYWLSY